MHAGELITFFPSICDARNLQSGIFFFNKFFFFPIFFNHISSQSDAINVINGTDAPQQAGFLYSADAKTEAEPSHTNAKHVEIVQNPRNLNRNEGWSPTHYK